MLHLSQSKHPLREGSSPFQSSTVLCCSFSLVLDLLLQTLSNQLSEFVLIYTVNDRSDQIPHAHVCGIHFVVGASIHWFCQPTEFHGLWTYVLKMGYEFHICLQSASLKRGLRTKLCQWHLPTTGSSWLLVSQGSGDCPEQVLRGLPSLWVLACLVFQAECKIFWNPMLVTL